ncbi:DNA translocase FtsK [uncultured Pseudoteredinibacter sp.]|uniref:DNA translocase FtsK n=1 Tax=uncultured Pseudoteredinibacter sp. TaxID=1641701 RepID=UPI002613078D|nr:DNA translocase FtsK [uncultured Pseudoteredinibacter sp.]
MDAQQRLFRLLREGALIGLILLCAFLLLSLFSYSPADPGWSRTGLGDDISNTGGPTGAWLADVFFTLFGYIAYVFPMLLLYRIWKILKDKQRNFDWVLLSLRSVGLALVMAGGTGIAALNFASELSALPFSNGGILGASVSGSSLAAFGFVGATLLMVAIFLFGMTIYADISWLGVMDETGRLTINAYRRAQEKFQHWQENRIQQQQVEEVVEKRRQAVAESIKVEAERVPPIISEPVKKAKPVSKRVEQERQVPLFDAPVSGELPPFNLLDPADPPSDKGYSKENLEALSRLLELKLKDFNIVAEVVSVLPGPVVTRFELQPAPGVKASRITNLAKDLARSLAVISVRVVEVIPGKSVVGIEIPNEHREMVRLREVLEAPAYEDSRSPLTVALGHDISGQAVVADIAKMPHLLVAGTTGSGKSVGVNVMLLSLLYKSTPKEVRLILVDPKMLELSIYEGIPHLLTPVITDMNDASNGLRWSVGEMERRYKLMAAVGVRNLAGFNRKVEEAIKAGEPMPDPLWVPEENFEAGHEQAPAPTLEPLPAIVIVIDEFADMMMIVGKKVEQLIARIAQKARAAGIHLVLATQRPSVDVITGLIKANVPSRMAFQVSSKIDSRTILDQGGAEQLLGHGDMLYLPPGTSVPTRVHGAFVDDHEVHKIVSDWRRRGEPAYIDGVVDESTNEIPVPGLATEGEEGGADEADALYDEAVAFVTESRKASISSVQRKLRIGYNRAARLIETMEAAGVISAAGHNGSREVLAPPPPKH